MSDALYLCLTAIVLLVLHQRHEDHMKGSDSDRVLLHRRVKALEEQKAADFDQAAFDDLKTKVEGLRLAQGLRR